jgi:hypothetical protein
MKIISIIILLSAGITGAQLNEGIQNLAKEFFEWRVVTQPCTGDDIPRVERPGMWVPDYSPKSIESYKKIYRDFKLKLQSLPKEGWSRADSVDYLLLHSAIERVNWELNILKQPNRNPDFYVHQTLGAVYELLLIHSPIDEQRGENIIVRLNSFAKTVEDAKINLTEPVLPFAEIALERLSDVRNRLYKMRDALNELLPADLHEKLNTAVESAAASLESYSDWIEKEKTKMISAFNVGREGYEYFLKNIALIPYSPEELLLMGKQEWDRSVSFDVMEKKRNEGQPELEIFSSAEEQIGKEKLYEDEIRKFLEEKNIMTVPGWVHHYINKKIPPHIAPFTMMGVVDDLTSETRLDEDGVSYIPEPGPSMSYFRLATAKDPRPIIIHEGVPGHYFQLVLSWANPDPVRRRYFDSGANEGIGFYVEELLLQFGLFDDSPRTREIIYSFMRLRALRVDVDINLALGNYTIEQAGKYLAATVPMDLETGIHEARFFAYNPGQAITYQIGKLQIMNFLSDAKILLWDDFNLRKFHDYLMENGNVPIALLRWEYLGLKDEIKKLWPLN